MKRQIIGLCLAVALAAIGCRGQVPPTSHTVNLTWAAPTPTSTWTGCSSSAPCSYVVSRAPASAGVCPVTTGALYAPINQSSPVTGTSYVDGSATGLTVCYIVQTLQGSAVSQPSNVAGPSTVPGNPLAPSLSNPAVALTVKPALTSPAPTELVYAMNISKPIRPELVHAMNLPRPISLRIGR